MIANGSGIKKHLKFKNVVQISGLALLLCACSERPTEISKMSEMISRTLAETSDAKTGSEPAIAPLNGGLRVALASAVQANSGYIAALATEADALSQTGVAESARRPQLRGNVNAGGIRETGNGSNTTTTGAAGGVNVSQLVYDGGESKATVNGATAKALAAQADRKVRANEIAAEAARAWIDVWQFSARKSLLHTRSSEMEMLLSQIERMASNGMIDRAALDSARRQIVDIKLEKTRLEAEMSDAQVRFKHYFRDTPESLPRPEELVSLAQARSAAATWQQAPSLQRAAADVLQSNSALETAKAALRPRARLQAGVTSPMKTTDSTDVSVGLMVDYTFGDGGRRRAQIKGAEARANAAKAQLSDSQLTLQARIESALTRLASIESSMPLVKEQIRLSGSESKTARSQITTGQSNLRQLVEAEIENYRAQDRQIAMQAERQILLLSIAAMTGTLTETLGLDDDAAN
jgi:outer membrane protein, adhesin transport system